MLSVPNSLTDMGFFLLDGCPTNEELQSLSRELNEWKPLGRCLNFGEGELMGIHKDNEEFVEKVYAMLRKWKEREGVYATYDVLHKALCHENVNRGDLAHKYCSVIL